MKAASPGTMSLTLNPMPSVKELLGGLLVGRAEHDVAELARPDNAFPLDTRSATLGARVEAWGVRGRRGRWFLVVAAGDFDEDDYSGARVHGPDPALGALDRDVQGGQRGGHTVEVVRIVSPDTQLEQAPPLGVDDSQLFPAVDGREGVVSD